MASACPSGPALRDQWAMSSSPACTPGGGRRRHAVAPGAATGRAERCSLAAGEHLVEWGGAAALGGLRPRCCRAGGRHAARRWTRPQALVAEHATAYPRRQAWCEGACCAWPVRARGGRRRGHARRAHDAPPAFWDPARPARRIFRRRAQGGARLWRLSVPQTAPMACRVSSSSMPGWRAALACTSIAGRQLRDAAPRRAATRCPATSRAPLRRQRRWTASKQLKAAWRLQPGEDTTQDMVERPTTSASITSPSASPTCAAMEQWLGRAAGRPPGAGGGLRHRLVDRRTPLRRPSTHWLATDLNPETLAVAQSQAMPRRVNVRFDIVDAYTLESLTRAELGDETLRRRLCRLLVEPRAAAAPARLAGHAACAAGGRARGWCCWTTASCRPAARRSTACDAEAGNTYQHCARWTTAARTRC